MIEIIHRVFADDKGPGRVTEKELIPYLELHMPQGYHK